MNRKSTSPWVYVGCTCFGLAALAVAGVVSLGYFGVRFAKNAEAELRNPEVRLARSLEILGAEELPAGFRPQLHFKLPLLFEMVALSDGEAVEFDSAGNQELKSEQLGDNAFIYMALADVGSTRADMEKLLEGDTRGLDQVQINLDFRSQNLLGRGEIEVPPQRVRYAAHRGEFRDGRERRQGIYSILLIECPSSSKVRTAFYWQRLEEIDVGGAPAGGDLAGTPYEEGLRRFMGHFNVCGEA